MDTENNSKQIVCRKTKLNIQWTVCVSLYHVAAVGSRPLSVQSCGHLQPSVLLPVGPAWSAQATLHVGRSPWVPLVGAAGYTHEHNHTGKHRQESECSVTEQHTHKCWDGL